MDAIRSAMVWRKNQFLFDTEFAYPGDTTIDLFCTPLGQYLRGSKIPKGIEHTNLINSGSLAAPLEFRVQKIQITLALRDSWWRHPIKQWITKKRINEFNSAAQLKLNATEVCLPQLTSEDSFHVQVKLPEVKVPVQVQIILHGPLYTCL